MIGLRLHIMLIILTSASGRMDNLPRGVSTLQDTARHVPEDGPRAGDSR